MMVFRAFTEEENPGTSVSASIANSSNKKSVKRTRGKGECEAKIKINSIGDFFGLIYVLNVKKFSLSQLYSFFAELTKINLLVH